MSIFNIGGENDDKEAFNQVDDTSGLSWGGQTYETDDGLVHGG